MAGQLKVDSINADSNLTLRIANTAVAFIDSNGLRPSSGNVSLDATGTTGIGSPSANTLVFYEGGVEAMRIDSSGNVGIGTTSPGAKLVTTGAMQVQIGSFPSTGNGLEFNFTGGNTGYVYGYDRGTSTWRDVVFGGSTLQYSTGGTERMRITSAGVVELAAGQLKFPATQNPSSDGNTLDDYEEGTWTPTVSGVSTYTVQNGTYIKIGKYVHIAGDVSGTDPGSLTSLIITSLPFVSQGSPTVYGVGSVFPVSGFNTNATSTILQGTPGQAQAIVYWVSSGATNYNQITSADLLATFTFEFSLSYLANA